MYMSKKKLLVSGSHTYQPLSVAWCG